MIDSATLSHLSDKDLSGLLIECRRTLRHRWLEKVKEIKPSWASWVAFQYCGTAYFYRNEPTSNDFGYLSSYGMMANDLPVWQPGLALAGDKFYIGEVNDE